MKLFFILLISLLLTTCGSPPETQNKADLAEKNKETALKNEVTQAIELAQKLEKQGRALDYYYQKSCLKTAVEQRLVLEDFKTRAEKLPDDYRNKLLSIYEDLDNCLVCQKKAIESCKKARAAINQIIKEIYPK